MKIVVAQFYTNNVPYAKYSTEINEKYCNDNSYIYFTVNNTQKIINSLDGRSITWYKPHLIKEVFSLHPDVDYILFLDIDAVITDHTKKIEDFITDDFSIMMTRDYGPSIVNAGVMFIKNDDYSKDFIQKWWDICEEYPQYKTGLWHDQTCIGLLYEKLGDKTRFRIVSYDILNSSIYGRGEFIFHAFSYGNLRNRTLDSVYYRLFNVEPEVDNNSLMELGEVFPTDKHYQHNYFSQVYQDVLSPIKNDVKTLLEIGILDGNSLKVFKRFFKDAKVYGVDLRSDTIDGDIEVIKCDQSDEEDLNLLVERFSDGIDVILDDGSHKMYDQQITMAVMFNALKSGGIFIMEDLHTSTECLMPEKVMFGWGDPTKTTTLQMLENYNNTGIVKSDYLTDEQCQYLTDNIDFCEVYHLNGGLSITSIIKKK
jgi:hypothetical protein